MPEPQSALAKATGIGRGRSRLQQTLGDILMGGVDVLTGALGIPSGVESKGVTVGELLSAGLPIVGGIKAAQAAKRVANPIKAYHASPHDFDQFSLSKIGTGEGAQAYGHGLYFAESPKTAKAYWDQFEGRNFSDPEKVAVAAAKALEPLADGSVLFGGRMWSPDKWVEAFKTGELTGHKLPPGVRDRVEKALLPKTYEVSINADPEDFLDWDAPLSQQPRQAQEMYSGLVREHLNTRPIGKASDGTELVDVMIGRSSIGAYPKDKVPEVLANPAKYVPLKGQQFYEMLASAKGGPGPSADWGKVPSKPAATETLKGSGIPGIKYLDGASRSAGQGSRNYVVFDDSLIDILKKYGLAGVAGSSIGQMLGMSGQPQRGQ